jgi:hypothetical protein
VGSWRDTIPKSHERERQRRRFLRFGRRRQQRPAHFTNKSRASEIEHVLVLSGAYLFWRRRYRCVRDWTRRQRSRQDTSSAITTDQAVRRPGFQQPATTSGLHSRTEKQWAVRVRARRRRRHSSIPEARLPRYPTTNMSARIVPRLLQEFPVESFMSSLQESNMQRARLPSTQSSQVWISGHANRARPRPNT